MGVPNLFDLSGRVAIVMGGGDGPGRMLATGLAEAGSDIVVCSSKVEKYEATARDLEKLSVRTMAIQCDIGRDEDVDAVVSETVKEFQKIDILVNNSVRTWGASPEDIPLKDWQKVIDLIKDLRLVWGKYDTTIINYHHEQAKKM
jgi:gluconate 5-dehydrogenase